MDPPTSTDVVVVAVSGTIYNTSGPSAGITCVGTSTITVYPGTTVGQLESGIESQDGSAQTWVAFDASSDVLSGSAVIANGDTLTVTAADGTDTYTYALAVFNNPSELGLPGGINPVTGWLEGNYWNEALYFQIDSGVNANRPNFPNQVFTLTAPAYAALVTQITEGTGTSAHTGAYYYGAAINQAIYDCNAAGGGKVVIPVGGSLNTNIMANAQSVACQPNSLYYSGSINLLSNVDLYLAPGCHVAFVRNATNFYYPLMPMTYQGQIMLGYAAPLFGLNQTNIALTGGGTTSCYDMLNHVGSWSYPTLATGASTNSNPVLNDQDYDSIPLINRIDTDIGTVPALVPEVVGGWGSGQGYTLVAPPAGLVTGSALTNVHARGVAQPELLSVFYCTNFYVAGTEDYSSQFWNTHPFQCTNVIFQNYCSFEEQHLTDDGLDPESCTNVIMEDNSITAQDDCTAIKAGRNVETRWPIADGFGNFIVRTPAQNEIVRNTNYYNLSGGSSTLSAGSENAAGVFNTFIENCTTGGGGVQQILKFKTTAFRNNVVVGNMYCRNFTMTKGSNIIQVDPNYSESVSYPNANVCNETFRDIYIENCNLAPPASPTSGQPWSIASGNSRAPQTNLNYRNSTFYCTGSTNTYGKAFASLPFFCNLNASAVSMVDTTTSVTTVVNTTPINLKSATINVENASITLAADSEYNTGQPANDSSDTWTGPYTFTRAEPVNNVPSRTSLVVKGQLDLSTYPTFATPTASGGAGGVVNVYVDRTTTAVATTLTTTGAFTSNPIMLTDSPEPFWYMGYHIVSLVIHDSTYLNVNGAIFNVAYQQDTTPPTVESLQASPSQLTVSAGNSQVVNVVVNAVDALDSAPVSTITSVTANTGPIVSGVDYTINGPLQVTLLATAGRVYTITVTSTDSWGNVSTAAVSVIGYQATKAPIIRPLL
jgi:polygalacturonase